MVVLVDGAGGREGEAERKGRVEKRRGWVFLGGWALVYLLMEVLDRM